MSYVKLYNSTPVDLVVSADDGEEVVRVKVPSQNFAVVSEKIGKAIQQSHPTLEVGAATKKEYLDYRAVKEKEEKEEKKRLEEKKKRDEEQAKEEAKRQKEKKEAREKAEKAAQKAEAKHLEELKAKELKQVQELEEIQKAEEKAKEDEFKKVVEATVAAVLKAQKGSSKKKR